jgi:hypothetical protein
MTLKLLTLDGTVGDSLAEVPESQVSKMLLAHRNYFVCEQNIREIFLTGFIGINLK